VPGTSVLRCTLYKGVDCDGLSYPSGTFTAAEVSDLDEIIRDEDVFWFDVAMEYIFAVHILYCL
jgi:hypothetical protein